MLRVWRAVALAGSSLALQPFPRGEGRDHVSEGQAAARTEGCVLKLSLRCPLTFPPELKTSLPQESCKVHDPTSSLNSIRQNHQPRLLSGHPSTSAPPPPSASIHLHPSPLIAHRIAYERASRQTSTLQIVA